MPALHDVNARPMRSLRVSVTDRCNLRCGYCMPERDYVWLPRRELLTFDELARVVTVCAGLGVDRVRLTGGEPLVRAELAVLVRMLARIEGIRDVALTTNAVLLEEYAVALRRAGLQRITISLDSTRRVRFAEMVGRDQLDAVMAGLAAARDAGFEGTKLNMVVLRGSNDDELLAMLELGREHDAEVRFIEYMDVGGATRWRPEQVFGRDEILATIAAARGAPRPLAGRGSAPAQRFALPDGQVFGVIASTTAPFCGSCDRARLTADGTLYRCLYARDGFDLRGPLRNGADDANLSALLAGLWRRRRDRGAEERLTVAERGALVDRDALRSDPRLEMHTRGG